MATKNLIAGANFKVAVIEFLHQEMLIIIKGQFPYIKLLRELICNVNNAQMQSILWLA